MFRHKSSKLVVEPIEEGNQYIQDSSFTIKPGLIKTGVSFESINKPGFYLRHKGGEVLLEQLVDGGNFTSDASFSLHESFSGVSRAIAIQSVNLVGYWLKATETNVVLSKYRGTPSFIQGASWKPRGNFY